MNLSAKVKVAILAGEKPEDSMPWVAACESMSERVDFEIIDMIASDWLEHLRQKKFDLLLARPGGMTTYFKQLYDERVYIIAYTLGINIFPSPIEIFIYENKRFLYSWLEANSIPAPVTSVFYRYEDALTYLDNCSYPIVAKTNIGASGSGVKIVYSKREGRSYLRRTFHGKGAPQRTGPNLRSEGLIRRGLNYILNPSQIKGKLNTYNIKSANLQRHYVLFQEYIKHDYEWRVVRIGDSYFAHKKISIGRMASGTLLKGYENPPFALLDFVKEITDKHTLLSQAVDVFEHNGGYLINEMQCFFGQSDPFQMKVNGVIGRYRFCGGSWIFEEGDFARNM